MKVARIKSWVIVTFTLRLDIGCAQKKFWHKRSLMGCIWSSMNVPGTGSPLVHPILKLDDLPFLIIGPLG